MPYKLPENKTFPTKANKFAHFAIGACCIVGCFSMPASTGWVGSVAKSPTKECTKWYISNLRYEAYRLHETVFDVCIIQAIVHRL